MTEIEELPYFIVVTGSTREDFQDKLNYFAEDGYKLAKAGTKDNIDVGQYYYGVMYLDLGYRNVTNLADVKPQDVDKYLDNGWEIASTSISTRFVRMIKRGNRGDTGAEGEGASATIGVAD